MTDERIKKLYDNMLNHISELVSGEDLILTLRAIGFTDEEIAYEGFMKTKIDHNELLMELREQP